MIAAYEFIAAEKQLHVADRCHAIILVGVTIAVFYIIIKSVSVLACYVGYVFGRLKASFDFKRTYTGSDYVIKVTQR